MATDQAYIRELTESNEKLHKRLSALRSELGHWRLKWILAKETLSEALKERDEAKTQANKAAATFNLLLDSKEAENQRLKQDYEMAAMRYADLQEAVSVLQAERDYWVESANQKANLLNAARSELDMVKSRLVDCYRGKQPPEAVADLLIAVNDIEAAWANLLEVLAKYGYKRE